MNVAKVLFSINVHHYPPALPPSHFPTFLLTFRFYRESFQSAKTLHANAFYSDVLWLGAELIFLFVNVNSIKWTLSSCVSVGCAAVSWIGIIHTNKSSKLLVSPPKRNLSRSHFLFPSICSTILSAAASFQKPLWITLATTVQKWPDLTPWLLKWNSFKSKILSMSFSA